MATDKHELAKQVALCMVRPLNRAGTESAKKCMDDAGRNYQPSTVLPARIGVSAGDGNGNIVHSYPSASGNRHNGHHNASSNPEHYKHISNSRITNPNVYIRDPKDPLPINGKCFGDCDVHYDHTNRVVYLWGWLLSEEVTHQTFGNNNGLNYVRERKQIRK
jgi:hypothetical protein